MIKIIIFMGAIYQSFDDIGRGGGDKLEK